MHCAVFFLVKMPKVMQQIKKKRSKTQKPMLKSQHFPSTHHCNLPAKMISPFEPRLLFSHFTIQYRLKAFSRRNRGTLSISPERGADIHLYTTVRLEHSSQTIRFSCLTYATAEWQRICCRLHIRFISESKQKRSYHYSNTVRQKKKLYQAWTWLCTQK